MSRIENLSSESLVNPQENLVNPNSSIGQSGCCVTCERNHAKTSPNCQNVSLGKGGGGR
ncbi:MAG: hypothetical protein LBT09_00110 [Planctomycetaceae bacterium]|jgi:hypothetical protein|nr:hypothetical protein [Planctomycetaceae bacterium]